ncbi:hypothetical protein [Rhizobium oryzicola]|uniref:Uncharacterized protein n=1 Tax=Rhizobium oryzicola TaxID=1232668 RepID=A0ABT8T410_9HYPH|nr:hypothetical protein [Rhizobium oryzicola]MDO1584888.1 hypothetical protein [Rhizobium oryzicola]
MSDTNSILLSLLILATAMMTMKTVVDVPLQARLPITLQHWPMR